MPPVKAIQEFAKAAVDLAPCLLVPTPASILPFIKDLLCMILRALKCFLSALKSVLKILQSIEPKMLAAQLANNTSLILTLECAKENAEIQAQHLMASIEPIKVVLDLAGSLFEIAGIKAPVLPNLRDGLDLHTLNNVVQTMQTVVADLQIVADARAAATNARGSHRHGMEVPHQSERQGGLSYSRGPERIQDAIWIVLSTSAGERVMRPEFGAGVNDRVFDPNSSVVRAQLVSTIREALVKWEPRIELAGVRADQGSEPSLVLISIDYRLRSTNEIFNLVYPLYVQEGAG